ncbi:MAG: hypothetical protein U1F76_31405 [Candidatus Competibacteraceae bacterium]
MGLVSPARQVAFVSLWDSSAGLWTSAGIRLVFGIALWFVAPAARTPIVLQVLAVLAIVAAILLPFLGLARFQVILAWWCRQPPAVIRAWSVAAVAFGSFVLWSVLA